MGPSLRARVLALLIIRQCVALGRRATGRAFDAWPIQPYTAKSVVRDTMVVPDQGGSLLSWETGSFARSARRVSL